ncbi:MAG: hypothetical protein WBG90_08250 [Saonia sp.]
MIQRYFTFLIILLIGYTLEAQSACACCTENHKAFDFWIGTWDVTNADGTAAGKNSIEKVQDSCLLRENWTSAKGKFTGSSTNFYNLETKQWEQLWIDNSGAHLKLKGNRTGNQMILSSDKFTHTDGEVYVNRITWTLNADGTVRQLWEVLQDDKVISVAFDGLYRKIK